MVRKSGSCSEDLFMGSFLVARKWEKGETGGGENALDGADAQV